MTAENKRSFDDAEPLEDADGFSADEQAAIERMQSETPMPSSNEGGDPPAVEAEDGKPRPKQEADAEPSEAELEDGEEEITIDGQGRERDKSTGQFVSKSALLRVKEQNKQTRTELENQRQENARILGRMQVLTDIINAAPADGKVQGQQQRAPTNPWEEADINKVEDLIGWAEQMERRAKFERQQREGIATAQTQQGQRERQVAEIQSYVSDAKRLAAEHEKTGLMVEVDGGQRVPAMQAAYAHLVKVRSAQLEALGMTDVQARMQRIAQEEGELVAQAHAARKSPAEMIMGLAQAVGFQMPSKSSGNGAAKSNGKSQAQVDAERKLNGINKGMQAAQSLSGKGGNAYRGLTVAQINAMDDDSFDAFCNSVGEEQLNKMLGAD
jgi:hypothetical protein